jgi:hypothetical protein
VPAQRPDVSRDRRTLLEVAADLRHLGATIGFLGILHTWGHTLIRHPHVHCVVPAGGAISNHRLLACLGAKYPDEAFVIQCLWQITGETGLLRDGRILLCDRDPKWSSGGSSG